MNRLLTLALNAGSMLTPALASAGTPAMSPSLPAQLAMSYGGHGRNNDFWEDRYNAMRKIWGTPYVPLGYYWNQVNGLPPQAAPVAPGVYADQPIYGRGLHRGHRGYRGYYQAAPPVVGYGPAYGPVPPPPAYAPGPFFYPGR